MRSKTTWNVLSFGNFVQKGTNCSAVATCNEMSGVVGVGGFLRS
jgi:hypothetical protein